MTPQQLLSMSLLNSEVLLKRIGDDIRGEVGEPLTDREIQQQLLLNQITIMQALLADYPEHLFQVRQRMEEVHKEGGRWVF